MTPLIGWISLALLLLTFVVCLTCASQGFGYDTHVIDMPVLTFTAGLVTAGLVFVCFLPPLVRASLQAPDEAHGYALGLIIATGVAARLILFASEPMLEDDYQRYLWDGAVTANGMNPYAVAPDDVPRQDNTGALGKLAIQSGAVIDRIGHSHLTTIYPPVTQAAFALSHMIEPWSLAAWRSILLVGEIATLALLLAFLRKANLSPLWVSLYWWNPLVVKELFNSAHMEAILMPPVLCALLLALNARPLLATGALSLAVGAKFWPALLLPFIWRPILSDWRKLGVAAALFGGLGAIWVAPMVLAGLDQGAGLVAYAGTWKINGPLFSIVEYAAAIALENVRMPIAVTANVAAKVMIAAGLGIFAIALAWRPIAGVTDLIERAIWLVAALLFLSPAVYPWYAVWLIPLLVLRPWLALLLLTATLPLYYTRFYFSARETYAIFETYIVWLIWVPVWLACFIALFNRSQRETTHVST